MSGAVKQSAVLKRFDNAPSPLADDLCLAQYAEILAERKTAAERLAKRLAGKGKTLGDFASGHEYYGLHFKEGRWIFREWLPNAQNVWLTGDFSNWCNDDRFKLTKKRNGVFEGVFPAEAIRHEMHYMIYVQFDDFNGALRIPAYARRVVQDAHTGSFCAQVWQPSTPYIFQYPVPPAKAPLIYEAHIGIAGEVAKVNCFEDFRRFNLPDIAAKGYNTIQLMGIMEHPYYGSFGYHVSNFFAVSSRFGTPEEFKALVDEAHKLGLRVIIDLVHSHAVRNEVEGLGAVDGKRETYFHAGGRGEHEAWDSLCFDYGKIDVLHFLLSNCRFYLDEYNIDGFRFDGVTSMLYLHHGLNRCFTSYEDYFGDDVDNDALAYLTLANKLIHEVRPDAVTIAEDVSGMPGLASKEGVGFDYRMAMGGTDMWFKLLDIPDECWNMFQLYGELTNRRQDERAIGYVECHDQAIVGGQSAIFRMAGSAMYFAMHRESGHPAVDRAVALHKLMRLASAATAGHGYLNFIGNEFGHPEWVDLPREGNNWSYEHARRLWHLEYDPQLRFGDLSAFDKAMTAIVGTAGFYQRPVQTVRIDDEKKIIVFERDDYWFIFNFHPGTSQVDYRFEARAGIYETVLDSDSGKFGGFDLREAGQTYYTLADKNGLQLSLYLPARSALVLKRRNVR